jgi:hypothetical protein
MNDQTHQENNCEHHWVLDHEEVERAGVYTGQFSDAYVGTITATYRCTKCNDVYTQSYEYG